MSKLYYILFATICCTVKGYKECGKPNFAPQNSNKDTYLSHAVEAGEHAFPWQLALEVGSHNFWTLKCGAVLLNANWAATAAQCVHLFNGESMRVLAGVHNLFDITDGRQIREITREEIYIFPDFNADTLSNDIALIHLKNAFNLSTSTVGPICLPPSSDTIYYDNPSCFITGWGRDKDLGEVASSLERIWTDVLHAGNCEAYIQRPVEAQELCTLDQVSHVATPCTGDEGGPLACAVDGVFYLAGIVSIHAEHCIGAIPQINVNIAYFDSWIRNTITGQP